MVPSRSRSRGPVLSQSPSSVRHPQVQSQVAHAGSGGAGNHIYEDGKNDAKDT
jgi:hypothetical protein